MPYNSVLDIDKNFFMSSNIDTQKKLMVSSEKCAMDRENKITSKCKICNCSMFIYLMRPYLLPVIPTKDRDQ